MAYWSIVKVKGFFRFYRIMTVTMKKIIYIMLLLLAMPFVAVAQTTGEPQYLETFRPDERTHDFGKIREADGK